MNQGLNRTNIRFLISKSKPMRIGLLMGIESPQLFYYFHLIIMSRKTLSSTIANYNADSFFNDKKMKEVSKVYRQSGELVSTINAVIAKLNEITAIINAERSKLSASVDENKVATCGSTMTKLTHLVTAVESVELFKSLFDKFNKPKDFDPADINELLGDLVN